MASNNRYGWPLASPGQVTGAHMLCTYCLHFRVGLQAILAQLPAAPRHLIAAKWGLGPEHIIAVDPVIREENTEVTVRDCMPFQAQYGPTILYGKRRHGTG